MSLHGRIINYIEECHPDFLVYIIQCVDVGELAPTILAYTPIRYPVGQRVIYNLCEEAYQTPYQAVIISEDSNPEPPQENFGTGHGIYFNGTNFEPEDFVPEEEINYEPEEIRLAFLANQDSNCDICYVSNHKLIRCVLYGERNNHHTKGVYYFCENCVFKMSKIFNNKEIKPVQLVNRELDLT